jgi:hypothetical protein
MTDRVNEDSLTEGETVNIPAPKFGLYESVILHWNEREIPTSIVARWYDFDHQSWWYKVSNDERFYSGDVLAPR